MLGTSLALDAVSANQVLEKPLSLQIAILAPLLVGVMVGAIAWLLLRSESETGSPAHGKVCAGCGSPILENWRLCPDCGRFIEHPEAGDGPPTTGARSSGSDSELSF